jgi:NAD(P)-dependent dehydrogenase (short-subunit alcohol dehydrogenase family)
MLFTVNLKGFLYVTQGCVRQMLTQSRPGSVISITASAAANPIAGVLGSVPMITKGGIDAITRSLAIEYAKNGIRFNSVALGIVDTPMHAAESKEFLKTLSPMGTISSVSDVVDAVAYLATADNVTGEVLHVDGGAHQGSMVSDIPRCCPSGCSAIQPIVNDGISDCCEWEAWHRGTARRVGPPLVQRQVGRELDL